MNISVPSTKNRNILEKSDKYRQISPNIAFFLKCFDFWLMGPKYSCSADENTLEKCLVIKKFFFFFFGIEFSVILSKVCRFREVFEVRI